MTTAEILEMQNRIKQLEKDLRMVAEYIDVVSDNTICNKKSCQEKILAANQVLIDAGVPNRIPPKSVLTE